MYRPPDAHVVAARDCEAVRRCAGAAAAAAREGGASERADHEHDELGYDDAGREIPVHSAAAFRGRAEGYERHGPKERNGQAHLRCVEHEFGQEC